MYADLAGLLSLKFLNFKLEGPVEINELKLHLCYLEAFVLMLLF